MTVRLMGAALLLEAAAESIVRVVVVRSELEHRPELRRCLVVAADAEVRDPERLPDRSLVRRAPLRLLERHGCLSRPPVLQMRLALLKEVVQLVTAHLSHRSRRCSSTLVTAHRPRKTSYSSWPLICLTVADAARPL